MTSKYILGIDISTNIIGYTIFDEKGEMVLISSCELNKKLNMVQRALFFKDILKDIKDKYNIGSIWIEEPFMMFQKGRSSAKTIFTLASFNGMIQYSCLDIFNLIPNLINVSRARKTVGLKVPRGSDTKEVVLSWVKSKTTKVQWPTKTLKSGPRKGLTIQHPRCYDMADAYIIGLAGYVKDFFTK